MDTATDQRSTIVALTLPDDPSPTVVVEQYYVEAGVEVRAGDAACLLRSDRYAFDIPAPRSGIVQAVLVEPGTAIAPGAPLLLLGEQEQAADDDNGHRARVTPLARAIASAHARDLAAIPASATDGRIRAVDVWATIDAGIDPAPLATLPDLGPMSGEQPAAAAPPGPPAAHEPASINLPALPLLAEQPYALSAIDVDLPHPARDHQAKGRDVTITPAARVAYAVAAALVEHPWLNSTWTDDGVLVYGRIDLGMTSAFERTRRLILIPRAADLSLAGMARAIADVPLVDDRQPPTFLIHAHFDATWWSAPVANPGTGAMLTMNPAQRRPVVVETADGPVIAARDRVVLLLAYDARYIMPTEADRFLASVRALVEAIASI